MKKFLSILFVLSLSYSAIVIAQESDDADAPEVSTVEELLMLVKEGKTKEQTENSKREAEFLANKNKQAEILAAEKRELARQERIADQLEAEYKKNEEILRVKEEAYQKELGSLVELFGHLQSSAGEAAVQFSGSLTSAQFGTERVDFLNDLTSKMSETTELPTIREIEGLWFELQREMAASGQVVSFDTTVVDVDGEANVVISGLAVTSAVGSVTVHHNAKFNIDGVSASSSLGSITTISKANVSVTGLSATGFVTNVLVWGLIDDTQTPNYANINSTQTPNWEEVA